MRCRGRGGEGCRLGGQWQSVQVDGVVGEGAEGLKGVSGFFLVLQGSSS